MGSIPGKKRGPYKGAKEYSASYAAYGMGWKQKRESVLKRDDHTCHYCGSHAESVDHILAVANGGDHRDQNLVACCTACNSSKGARDRPGGVRPPLDAEPDADRASGRPVIDDRPPAPPDRTAAQVAAIPSGIRFVDGGVWRGRTVEPRAGGYAVAGCPTYGETP